MKINPNGFREYDARWLFEKDIDLEGIISKSSAYTPVPGGVGPMTINTLIMQTLESCEAHLGLD